MKSDERALLEALANLVDIDGWASPWSVSQNFDQPIHERRLEHIVSKWNRKGYWDPLLSMSGTFTPKGWAWLESLGIQRGGEIPLEQRNYAAWLADPDAPPHPPNRDGSPCCLPPDYSHRAAEEATA